MTSESAIKEMGLPPIFEDSLRRQNGLILLAGHAGSGLEDTLAGSMHQLKDRKIVPWSPGFDVHKSDRSLVLVDAEHGSSALEEVLMLAESGRLVVWMQHAPGPVTALRRLLSQSFGEGRRHLLWRLADQLILAAGQMRLRSNAGPKNQIDAFEILLLTPVLREALAAEDFEKIDQSLRSTDEHSGIVSFNQSLLQLLLRRHIDIKIAFEATRDPVNLDQILKKVGI